MSQHNSRESS